MGCSSSSSMQFKLFTVSRDRVAVVTGASSGIGYETAKHLAMMGFHVVLACRSKKKAEEAMKRMDEEFRMEKESGTEGLMPDEHLHTEFMELNLASLKSTQTFINAVKDKHRQLHLLICNAGVMMSHEVMTEDGLEMTYQVNFLGHFLIVAHLLPLMESSGEDCRIVIVSSEAHKYARFDTTIAGGDKMKRFHGFKCYANTKLFQIMQMYAMDHILEETSVDVLAVHPGMVDTGIFHGDETHRRRAGCLLCCARCCGVLKTPMEGAQNVIYAAVSPRLKGVSRGYYTDWRKGPQWPAREARIKELQQFLWTCSLERLKDYLPPDLLQQLTVKPTHRCSVVCHH